jgi:hypothetical protein
MAILYFRGMAAANDKPKVGRSARLLGVRPGIDIELLEVSQTWLDEVGYLRADLEQVVATDIVLLAVRNSKGMSTSISIETLPPHRKPINFGGTSRDPIWQIDSSYIAGDLEAVRDSPTHVSIMPRATMLLTKYELALANTQQYWQRVENFI